MIKYENNCCLCGIGCIDCGRKHQAVRVCDRCSAQDKLYSFADEELCSECLETALEKAIINDFSDFLYTFSDEICEYFDVEELKE